MQDYTNPYKPNQAGSHSAEIAVSSEAKFFQKVYMFMGLGLAITAFIAYFMIAATPELVVALLKNRTLFIVIMLAQLGLVFYVSAKSNTMAVPTMIGMLALYAALNGVIFSVILSLYNPYVAGKAFLTTALTFGSMSVYGLVTRRSLQGWGSFLYMGVVGLILAMVVNMVLAMFNIMPSNTVQMAICAMGVLIFAGLTAYHNQRLRVEFAALGENADSSAVTKIALHGALSLYLAFINIFLFLLRLFSGRQ